MTRDRVATIPIDDESEIVVSVDEIGRIDIREWSTCGYARFPSKHGVACPRLALGALIDALKAARRRDAA